MRAEPDVIDRVETGEWKNKETGVVHTQYENIFEAANCMAVISTVKHENREDEIIVCGDPTSWRCDVCLAWVCHYHFSTYNAGPDEEQHKHVCHECQKEKKTRR